MLRFSNAVVVVKFEYDVFYSLPALLEDGLGYLPRDLSSLLAHTSVLSHVCKYIFHHGSAMFQNSRNF